MTRKDFERHAEEAILAVPEKVRDRLQNVAFVIEETWERADREGGDYVPEELDEGCDLLGLYEGVPRSEFAGDPSGMLPDKITIFMDVVLDEAEESGDDPAEIIRHTVWHEIAHYFGFDEDGARRLERKWEGRFLEMRGKRSA